MTTDTTAPISPLPADASPQEKDRWWLENVYQGGGTPQLTCRAIVMGGLIGMVMAIANLYTTLKIGWSFGVAITASVLGYVSWSFIHKTTGARQMTMLENCCMQSTASSAGYATGGTVGTAFGALLMLTGQHSPWCIVAAQCLLVAVLGTLLAIPLKRQMINYEQLPFPSGIAAAATLKSLYAAGTEAVEKARILIAGILLGGVVQLLISGATLRDKCIELGLIKDGWLASLRFIPEEIHLPQKPAWLAWPSLDSLSRFKYWAFDPSLLLIAAGMIVGLRVCLSMLCGSLILHLFVAPYLLAQDAANIGTIGWVNNFPKYYGGDALTGSVIPFRWALWGGCACMVMSSLTSLAFSWKTLVRAFALRKQESQSPTDHLEVPVRWMVIGLIPVGIGLIFLCQTAFNISWWLGILAVLLSFPVSLVCCRATGETDTTPIGAMGKVTQLAFSLFPSAQGLPHVNLIPAGITAAAGSSASDLLSDLKSGYLLGAHPRKQFWAQMIGVFFGTLAVVPAWYLLVPDKAALESYASPAVSAWEATARLLSQGFTALPVSAKWALVIGGLVGVVLPIVETLTPAKYRHFVPSAMGLGLSWILGFANALGFALGAVIAWVWQRLNPKYQDKACVPLSSGIIAGASLVAAFIAMTITIICLKYAN